MVRLGGLANCPPPALPTGMEPLASTFPNGRACGESQPPLFKSHQDCHPHPCLAHT